VKFLVELRLFILSRRLDPLPIRELAGNYPVGLLRSDIRAGLNVALLAFPQGLAYAAIADLPIVYGVTGSAIAAIVAPLFIGSRFTILGPTNATSFMIFSFFAAYRGLDAERWITLVILMAGIALIAGAFLRLADLMQYVSRSVVVGYVTGAALLIIANQTRHVLGIDFAQLDEMPTSFPRVVWCTTKLLPDLDVVTACLGGGVLVAYLLLAQRFRKLPLFAILLIVASIVGCFLQRAGSDIVTYRAQAFPAGEISGILPQLPDFGHPRFFDRIGQLFSLAMAIAFLSAMEQSVMAQTLGSRSGQRSDKNQDMLGVGMSNIACAFLSGMPASGSLTRSALNFTSGAVTRMSSIFCGVFCLVGVVTLGPMVAYIPKSALAALVICVAISLVSRKNLRICFRATNEDAVVVATTLAASLLLPLHVAIFVGVGTSIVLYLRQAARPHLVEYAFNEEGNLRATRPEQKRSNPFISIVHVEGELFFGAAELFRTQVQRTCQDPDLKVIILRMKNARHLDATSVMALEELVRALDEQERYLIVSGATEEVQGVFVRSGLLEVVGPENFFMGCPDNPTLATRNALLRAQELLGTKHAEIKIFYDPNKDPEHKG
jgi:SulP family sulfate permease